MMHNPVSSEYVAMEHVSGVQLHRIRYCQEWPGRSKRIACLSRYINAYLAESRTRVSSLWEHLFHWFPPLSKDVLYALQTHDFASVQMVGLGTGTTMLEKPDTILSGSLIEDHVSSSCLHLNGSAACWTHGWKGPKSVEVCVKGIHTLFP